MGMGVFGPLRLEGVSLSPRERIVLSALILRAGRPITTDELAEAVWRDDLPQTWPKQLQASVGRVRTAIGHTSIETSPGGYTLRVDPDTVDVERFEKLATSAREHLGGDDPARAVDAADRALALWRGTPYADLAAWPTALVEAERLDEVRMGLEEVRLDARLRLGAHEASIADAECLVRESPLRERRWTMLATALYRSGRQADALAAIRAAKERLAEELGAEPGEQLQELELAILRHDDSLDFGETPSAPSDTCPYRGLAPFRVEDENDFFGRDADVANALARLARSRFLAVSGASGSGKSSLVRAGLVPGLRRRGDRVAILTPERDLDVRVRDAVWGAGRADVLVVDQFEEAFHAGEIDVDAAARAIADAAANGTTVVLVVRSDFLDDCAAHPDLAPLVAEGVRLVGPMAPDALREAIEQPAKRAGLRLEPGLVELLLRDAAGEAGALPHLSHALVETWLRREGTTLTVAGYEASGGISGAIAQSADRLYQSMDAEQRALCRSVLLRLVALAPDGSPVRRRVPSKPLRTDAARDEVLTLLSHSRLVSAEADSVEVAHESLATAWPRLQSWLEEDAESTRLLTAVAAAAEAWNAAGRPDDDLYRGVRLQSALEWRDAAPRDLTDVEAAFIDASTVHATAERDALAERAHRDRRQNRRLRVLLTMAAGLVVLLVGAGSVALVASREAGAQRDSATIEALVGTALALRGSERDVSALLAAEAYRRWPDDPRTRSGLMGVLQGADGFLGNAFMGESAGNGAIIPGTELAFVAAQDGRLTVREVGTAEVVRQFEVAEFATIFYPRPLVAVSGNGRVGAVLSAAEVTDSPQSLTGIAIRSDLVVVDLETGALLLGPTRLKIGNGAFAINTDGSEVAIADAQDGAVTLISTATGTARPIANEHTTPLDRHTTPAAMTFDPDGRLIVGRRGPQLDIVDPTAATVVRSLAVPELSAHLSMTLSPSGMLFTSGDRSIMAYDLDGERVAWTTDSAYPSECFWLASSDAAERVYCGGEFGRIQQYDMADGTLLDPELGSLLGDSGPLFVSDEGTVLTAVVGIPGVISQWKLTGGGPAHRLIAPGEVVVGGFARESGAIPTAPQRIGAAELDSWDDMVVRDSADGTIDYRFDEPVSSVGWVAGDRILARFWDDDEFRIIDPGDPSVAVPLEDAEWFWITHAGTRVQTRTPDGRIVTRDARTLEPIGEPIEFDGWPGWVSAAPDTGRLAVSTFDREARPTADGTLSRIGVAIVEADSSEILEVARVHAATQVLIEGGEFIGMGDNRIDRYRTDPISLVGSVPGSAGGLGSPTLSDDGRTLLVIAGDGSALLYDMPSGVRIGDSIRLFKGVFFAGTLRPDGREMALSMPEGAVVWDLDPEHQFEAVCRIAGRNLTDEEWHTYLADFGEPQSTCGFGHTGGIRTP